MRKKSFLIVGSVFMLGIFEANTELIFAESIYNPLNPTEEITPQEPAIDPSTPPTEATEETIPQETVPSVEEQPQVIEAERNARKKAADHLESFGNRTKVLIEDVFSHNQELVNVPLPPDTPSGGSSNDEAYWSSLSFLLSGKFLYGKNQDGSGEHYVYDVFK